MSKTETDFYLLLISIFASLSLFLAALTGCCVLYAIKGG